MTIDHFGEFRFRFQTLPLQTRAPVLEEAPRPTFALVVPEWAERFLKQVGAVFTRLLAANSVFNVCLPS
jgi:hypothetical protein